MAQSGQGAGPLTPADADKHPFAQPVRGVREHDSRVQVAALYEHPEEVGHHEVVEDGGDAATPDLHGHVAVSRCLEPSPPVHSLSADRGESLS